jgi:hypothetical protein
MASLDNCSMEGFVRGLLSQIVNNIHTEPSSFSQLEHTPQPHLISTHPHPQLQLEQWHVLQQYDRFSCGYYCLFLALQFVRGFKTYSHFSEMNHLANRSDFYTYLNKWQTMLINHGETQGAEPDWYPWGKKVIQSTVMERPYLEWLIENDPEIQELNGTQSISALPEMYVESIGSGFLTLNQICNIQTTCELFHKPEAFTHGFIIGSTIHWVLLIVHKQAGDAEPKAFYIDSLNQSILGKSTDQLRTMAKNYYGLNPKYDTLSPSERERRERKFFSMLRGANFAVESILTAIHGNRSFLDVCAHMEVENVVEDWHEFHESQPDLSSKELLQAWLKSSYHPSQLHSKFRRVFSLLKDRPICTSSTSHARVSDWLKMVCSIWEPHSTKEGSIQPGAEPSSETECLATRFFKEILPHFRVLLGGNVEFSTNKHLLLSH